MAADRRLATVTALADRYARVRAAKTASVVELVVRALLRSLTGDAWYDDKAVAAAAGTAMRVVRTGQTQMASTTAAYLTSTVRALDPAAAPGRPPRLDLPEDLRWLDGTGQQYTRPAQTYRRLRAEGLDELIAADAAAERARRIAEDDMTLAVRQAAAGTLIQFPAVAGYRRVLRPELSKDGPCGLCIVAADRVYGRGELLPVHDRCKCDVLPIVGSRDPGRTLNDDDLKRLYAAAGSTDAAALKRVRAVVHPHGELGSVLRVHGQAYRGPKAAATSVAPMTPHRARVELASLTKTLAGLEERSARGEDVAGPLEYQRQRVELLRRLAAA